MTCESKIDHEAIKLDESAWLALAYVGVQRALKTSSASFELRNCPCGSTLARRVRELDARAA